MDAMRDVRYHSAKNKRKRRDKQETFATKRAWLGRTPSDVLHPATESKFRPLAMLDAIQHKAATLDVHRWCKCRLTLHAHLRMLQRGIAVRDLGSPGVHLVVVDDGLEPTIVTAWRTSSAAARRHRQHP